MRDFNSWLFEASLVNNIRIDLSEYEKQIRDAIDKVKDYTQRQAEELEDFKFDPNLVQQSDYPRKAQLIKALSIDSISNDEEYDLLDDEISKLSDWYREQLNNDNFSSELRQFYRHVLDREDQIKGLSRYNPDDFDQDYNRLVQQTQVNMEKLKDYISGLLSNTNYNGSPITLQAQAAYSTFNDIALEPADDAHVTVGSRYGSFSLFYDSGKIIIDDIVEGGFEDEDEEFFDNDKVKADYYTLIKELQNPGSTSKGKVLTLYTARPQKDRQFFQTTKTLPVNLFLTNSASHAEGLARDLAGGEARDVWMVRINSRYLVQTLDGLIKYYMVSVDNAPVVSMSLY